MSVHLDDNGGALSSHAGPAVYVESASGAWLAVRPDSSVEKVMSLPGSAVELVAQPDDEERREEVLNEVADKLADIEMSKRARTAVDEAIESLRVWTE